MPRILDRTTNLLALYQHAMGRSEVPREFHFWCCLSVLAASVGDRVWLEKFRGSKLLPNLYVLLLGPSGLGKGLAIDMATAFVKDIPRVNYYRGKASAQYLIDYLGRSHKDPNSGKWVIENTKLYLVTPELAMSVPSGEHGRNFIMHMTELYTGGDYLLQEGTRTRGGVHVKSPCMNWLAGTTREGLKISVPRDAVESGFYARVVTVDGHYDLTTRYRRPFYPVDYDEVMDHLHARITALTHLEGIFELSPDAERLEEAWYTTREAPEDERLLPSWKRAHDLMLKIAMLLALSETHEELVIKPDHVAKARIIVERALQAVPKVLDFARLTPEAAGVDEVAGVLKKSGAMMHSSLLRRTGMSADQFKAIIETLRQQQRIVTKRTANGAAVYAWSGQHRMPKEEQPAPED